MRLKNNEKQPIVVMFTDSGVPKTGLTPKISAWKISDESLIINNQDMSEIGSTGIYYYPAASLPNLSNDVLAVKCDGTATLAAADRYKAGAYFFGGTTGWVNDIGTILTNVDLIKTDTTDIIADIAALGGNVFTGQGAVMVNHNYGGSNALQVIDENSAPLDGAKILIYLKSDYDAGLRTASYVKGFSQTLVTGLWEWNIHLDPATYYAIVSKDGYEQIVPKEFTVTA